MVDEAAKGIAKTVLDDARSVELASHFDHLIPVLAPDPGLLEDVHVVDIGVGEDVPVKLHDVAAPSDWRKRRQALHELRIALQVGCQVFQPAELVNARCRKQHASMPSTS